MSQENRRKLNKDWNTFGDCGALSSDRAALKKVVKGILFKADGEHLKGDGKSIKNDGGALKADRWR